MLHVNGLGGLHSFAIAHFQAVCTVAGLGLFADTVVYLFPLQLRALR